MQERGGKEAMYKALTISATLPDELARGVEAHLNEFAAEIVSVSYAIGDGHHALVVYREIDTSGEAASDQAVAVAEQIIEDSVEFR